MRRPSRRPAPPVAQSRAERNIAWIERYLRVPEGRNVGQPVRLREWQKAELRRIYDNPAGTRRAILSFGRKNGKTALSAMILLLHLCGPEARRNSQLFSAAQSREQAAILFSLAANMVRMSPDLAAFVTVRDTAKQLACGDLGTLYRALSAEASTAYGFSPVLVVHDELGQVRGPRSELYEALETATGAQDQPLSIIISTQAPTDADLLSVLIDDALAGHDPRTVVSLYTAPAEMDAFSEEAIRKANPAFGDFQNAAETRAMAEDARRMPSLESKYRNLILNQRIEAEDPFVSEGVWKGCAGDVDDLDGVPLYGGLDLSATSDLTACVLMGSVDGIWHVKPTFWLPGTGLAEKSRADRVPYDVWHRQGFLEAAPGKSIEYEWVAVWLREAFSRYRIEVIAFDRWGFKHLKPWLVRAGFTEDDIERHFLEFGQGFQSMSPALRDLEGALLNGRLRHDGNPVLETCARNARVQTDPAGNRKLTKARSAGRIDGMVALTMAFGAAPMTPVAEASVYEERGLLVLG